MHTVSYRKTGLLSSTTDLHRSLKAVDICAVLKSRQVSVPSYHTMPGPLDERPEEGGEGGSLPEENSLEVTRK